MAKAPSPYLQMPLFEPESSWRPPSMDELPSWTDAKRIAIDCETRDTHLKELGIGVRRGGYITGVSFAIEDGPKHYLPMRHEGGDNLDCDQVLAYLRAQAKSFKGDIVGAHLPYDLDYLWEEDVHFPELRYFRDIQVADPLIYELERSYSLDEIAKRHGLPGKNEDKLREAARAFGVDPKQGMWRLPARYVGAYAEADVEQPLLTLRRQERLIDEKDLWDIWNLESQVLPVLVRMRRRGIRINFEKLESIEQWSLEEEAKALATVQQHSGVRVPVGDVWKAGAIAPALEAIGIVLNKTAQGQPNIDKDVLSGIDHPVAKALAWSRKVNKLRTTFAASVRRYEVNGRIHCTFKQIAQVDEKGETKGARYGRLSCVDPNLQQQPSRDEFAARWRSIYEPEEGSLWATNDYSQQEPRWTTHFAAEMDLPKAREAAQAYHDDPLLDNHDFMAQLTGLPRKYAKNVYLGLCYGEGGAKLSHDLGLPTRWALAGKWAGGRREIEFFTTQEAAFEARREKQSGYVFETAGEEAQHVLDEFDQRAPFIKQLAKKAEETAKSRGYVKTIGGRRLHFLQRADGSYDFTHKALNRIIQGSSADQTKKALVQLDADGHFIQLQVHDEIDCSVSGIEEGKAIGNTMRHVVTSRVPFRVDTEVGPSWGEAVEV